MESRDAGRHGSAEPLIQPAVGNCVVGLQFWPYFFYHAAVVFLYALAGGVTITVLPMLTNGMDFARRFWLVCAAGFLVSLLITAVCDFVVLPSAIRISREGIRIALPARGEAGSLSWEKIKRVQSSKRLWVRYLTLDDGGGLGFGILLSSVGRAVLRIPLVVDDRAKFKEAVLEFAPPGHALRQYVENEL